MNPREFRQAVLGERTLLGVFMNLGSAMTVEIGGRSGFDWLLLDHEHGAGSEETLLHQLWACSGTPAAPLVRVAWNDPVRLKRVLDLGPAGVMVPMINNAGEATAAVRAVRYPPRGIRGIARLNRSHAFGIDFAKNFATGHENFTTIAQIETPEAVAASAEIAAVEGIDVLFIGPSDLTGLMGIMDQFDHPDFVAARARVVAATKQHGKCAGILLPDPTRTAAMAKEGFRFIGIGSDGGAVTGGLRRICAEGRSALDSQ